MRKILNKGIPLAVLMAAGLASSGPVFGQGAGTVPSRFYSSVNGGAVSDLRNSSKFPDAPDQTDWVSTFESLFCDSCPAPFGNIDNYGTYITGYLIPATNGLYNFCVSSDDGSELWLSTDADPAHKVRIAHQDQWNGRRAFANPSHGGDNILLRRTQAPIALQGGKKYYIEALQKEGGGGDSLSVAWTDGDLTTFQDGNADQVIQSQYIQSSETLGPVAFFRSPGGVSVNEGATIKLDAVLNGDAPWNYQWKVTHKDSSSELLGSPVTTYGPQVILSFLAHAAHDGNLYSVVATNQSGASTAESAQGLVKVTADTTPPSVTAAIASGIPVATITVGFSEALDPGTAGDALNYSVDSAATFSAAALLTPNVVMLTIDSGTVPPGTKLTISGVKDASDAGNALNGTVDLVFTDGQIRLERYEDIGGGVNVTDLLSSQKYQAYAPSTILFPTVGADGPVNVLNNYGQQMSGYLTPLFSGYYIIYSSSDDASDVYLSTDSNPANKVKVAAQPVWNGHFDWNGNGSNIKSLPILLQAGQKYDVEGHEKEGGGGDNQSIGYSFLGGDPTSGGTAPDVIPAFTLSRYDVPANVAAGTPADVTVEETRHVTLSATLGGTQFRTVQWYDGANNPITDATNSTLTTDRVVLGNDLQFYVVNMNEVAINNTLVTYAATSRVATIHVVADTTPPSIVSAASRNNNGVIVTFSEEVDVTGATFTIAGLTVTDVIVIDDHTILLRTSPQGENAPYSLVATGVNDIKGNGITVAGGKANFTGPFFACGYVNYAIYSNIGGNTPADLVASPKYPNSPDQTGIISAMNSRLYYPDDTHETYGATLETFYTPDIDGDYIFYVASDDSSDLSLSTDEDPANLAVIVSETGCCNPLTSHASPPQTLVGGKRYLLRLLYKEGTGGDFGVAAVRNSTQSDSATLINGGAYNVSGSYAGIYVNESGTVVIATNPTDKTVGAATTVKFTSTATASFRSDTNYCVTWQSSADGGTTWTNVPFAHTPTLTLPFVPLSADGDKFRMVATVAGATATSTAATLHVTSDTNAPTVTKVIGLSTTTLAVFFSEPMGATTFDPFTFSFDEGNSVIGAVANAGDPTRVDVTLDPASPMTIGNTYNLEVKGDSGSGAQDLSGNPITPSPTKVTFVSTLVNVDPSTLPTLPTDGMLPLGSLTDRGFYNRFVQTGTAFGNDNGTTEIVLAGGLAGEGDNLVQFPCLRETGVINYSDGGPLGHLSPDKIWPCITANVNYFVMETLTYVEFTRAGVFTFGVASDDGFRVTSATGVTDPNNAKILGEFSGGRGVADTTFSFVIDKPGLYPIRLTYEEGTGGNNVELWENPTTSETVTYVGVNDDANGGLKAFLPPTPSPTPTITTALVGGNVVMSWPTTPGFCLVGRNDVATGSWTPVKSLLTTSGGTSSISVPASAAFNFYELKLAQ